MVLKELLYLPNLLGAQTFYFYNLIKMVIIYKNKNLILAIPQIIKQSFKDFNNL